MPLAPFDKYEYYINSVQSPENDVEFFSKTYKKIKGYAPESFREDFCGTFALSCEWVKLRKQNKAIGLDLDAEPTDYGKKHYLSKLSKAEQSRVDIRLQNVLQGPLPTAQLIAAVNFSYFIFKDRPTLKAYFQEVYNSLSNDGIFIVDCFGGTKCHEPNEEEIEYTDLNYSYFWDQDTFSPINNYAQFYIHFKRKGEKKRSKVFSYDWRMWSLAELQEILTEVGFKNKTVYWEGSDKKGDGNGIYLPTTEGEVCEAWVAYIVSEKS